MKPVNQLLLILLCLLSISNVATFAQQTSVDANRMNRDINIMENILEEMFKTSTYHSGESSSFVFGGDLFMGSSRGIRGTHLPGYGVIFTIPCRSGPQVIGLRNEDGETSYSYRFVYGSDQANDTDITEESVVERITDFLRDYGSTIGQLDSDDRVMVVFGANRSNRHEPMFVIDGGHKKPDLLPTISVAARKSDLDDYRSGRINENQFWDRLSIAKTNASEKRQLDLQVMANIFETAFKDTEEKSFRIRGSVNHLKLDNFGALFFFDASYVSSNHGFSFDYAPHISVWSNGGEESRVEIEKELKRNAEELEKERRERAKETNEAIEKAYDTFKNKLEDFLVDYGRTINSIEPDQYVMVSVGLPSRNENIPDRLDMQVQKSVLTAMDRGSTSREQALEQVVVTEY